MLRETARNCSKLFDEHAEHPLPPNSKLRGSLPVEEVNYTNQYASGIASALGYGNAAVSDRAYEESGGRREFPPSPVLYVISSTGELLSWHIVDLQSKKDELWRWSSGTRPGPKSAGRTETARAIGPNRMSWQDA